MQTESSAAGIEKLYDQTTIRVRNSRRCVARPEWRGGGEGPDPAVVRCAGAFRRDVSDLGVQRDARTASDFGGKPGHLSDRPRCDLQQAAKVGRSAVER